MRVFVAIPLPPGIRERLASVYFETNNIKWTPPENLHLTLKFIGEISEDETQALATELGNIDHHSFELNIHGWGAFPNRNHPNVIWADINSNRALANLYCKIETRCKLLGFAEDERSFKAHVTLGRVSEKAWDKFRKSNMEERLTKPLVQKCSFLVSSFCLYESQLNHKGAHYRVFKRYNLG